MQTRSILAVALATACAVPGCATGRAPDVFGRRVELVPKEPGAPRTTGELLAVQDGRFFVRTGQGVRDLPASSLREVRVRRHDLGRGVRRIGLVGGAVSLAALTASCSSVEGNGAGGCAAAGAIVGGLFALTGLLSGIALDSSANAHLSAGDDRLRGYARFPAGLPRGVPPEWLWQEPAAKERSARHPE
jgi:hypothetical protein